MSELLTDPDGNVVGRVISDPRRCCTEMVEVEVRGADGTVTREPRTYYLPRHDHAIGLLPSGLHVYRNDTGQPIEVEDPRRGQAQHD